MIVKCNKMIFNLQRKLPFFFLLLFSANGRIFNNENKFGKNFINVIIKNDFRELRIAFKGLLVMETSAFQNSSYEMHFRQISNGRDLIQLIFQNGLVKDCEYSREPKQILEFVEKFSMADDIFKDTDNGNVFYLYRTGDISNGSTAINHFHHRKDLIDFRDFVKIKSAKKMCNKLVEKSLEVSDKFNNFQYIRIKNGKSKRGKHGKKNGGKHNKNRKWPPHVTEGGIRTIDDSSTIERHIRKRSTVNRFLMFPGTKWCGRGQTALHYHDIGEDREADVCCRDHDCCPDLIPSFTTRFNIFNFRFHAILHCDCDNK